MTTDSNLALSANYTYENDLLTKIQTPSTTYTFDYGAFALRSSVTIGDWELAKYTYTDRTNYLNTLAYGNGDSVQYTYDQQGRVTQESYYEDNSTTVSDTVKYQYDNDGALAAVIDSETGITSKYYYDFIDRLCKYTESGENHSLIMEYGFDNMNNMTTIVETINGNRRSTSITYDLDNRVTSLRKGSVTEAYTYDDYSRVSDKTTTLNGETRLTEHIAYRSPSTGTTTGQIASLTIDAANHDVTYSYTYDNNGNIISVSDGTHTTTYTYDSANQLIREDNQGANKSWKWTYNNAGNIVKREEFDYTTSELLDTVNYAYGDTSWGDLLTSYNGQTIQYDGIGNPISDGTWTYTWQHGRELASMTDGSTTWNYTYNADGLRTQRTNGSLTYQYYYADGQLVRIAVGNKYLDISYDASGTPMSLYYSGYQVDEETKGNYYYVTNIQGDVVAILDDEGTAVVTYTYDAWGNILAVGGTMADTLGVYNPLRYRGYVYDNETGLYYLQSRYYDPEMGRFINADVLVSTGCGLLGNNMFAYCNNSPVFRSDYSGMFSVVGAMVGGITSFIAAYATGKNLNDSLLEGAKGALCGGLETFAIVAYVAIAALDFNSYMIDGMDIWTALGLTALSFGTSFLSASLLGKLLKCNLGKFTEVVVDLTFGEAINLTSAVITTSVSNNPPKQPTNVGTPDTYNPPAAPPAYFGGGPGGGPANTYFCFY